MVKSPTDKQVWLQSRAPHESECCLHELKKVRTREGFTRHVRLGLLHGMHGVRCSRGGGRIGWHRWRGGTALLQLRCGQCNTTSLNCRLMEQPDWTGPIPGAPQRCAGHPYSCLKAYQEQAQVRVSYLLGSKGRRTSCVRAWCF